MVGEWGSTMINMRPWSQWFVNHNLKFVLYIWLIGITPISVVVYAGVSIVLTVVEFVPDVIRMVKIDFRRVYDAERTFPKIK